MEDEKVKRGSTDYTDPLYMHRQLNGIGNFNRKMETDKIIPRWPEDGGQKKPTKFWVTDGTTIAGVSTQENAETAAIELARRHPGTTFRVTKTVKAFRTKEPAVETLESE